MFEATVRGDGWLFSTAADYARFMQLFLNRGRAGSVCLLSDRTTDVMTTNQLLTIIAFLPGGWNEAAGGFPAMQGNVAFLMKDVVLLAVSVYLVKQDVERAVRVVPRAGRECAAQPRPDGRVDILTTRHLLDATRGQWAQQCAQYKSKTTALQLPGKEYVRCNRTG